MGNTLVNALPVIIKLLSVVGTLALLLVSGGIFTHNISIFHHLLDSIPGILRDFIVGAIILLSSLNFKILSQ